MLGKLLRIREKAREARRQGRMPEFEPLQAERLCKGSRNRPEGRLGKKPLKATQECWKKAGDAVAGCGTTPGKPLRARGKAQRRPAREAATGSEKAKETVTSPGSHSLSRYGLRKKAKATVTAQRDGWEAVTGQREGPEKASQGSRYGLRES